MDARLPFELCAPGTWIDLADKEAAWSIQTQLSLVQSAFDEAAMALILFEQTRGNSDHQLNRQEWEADSNRRSELTHLLEAQVESPDAPFDRERWDEIRIQVDRQLMLEKWVKGIIPKQMRHHVPFIYAKAFLYAADSIGKILDRLAERADVPAATAAACDAYYDLFPELREVRNSAQHIEDRGRSLGKAGKPLDLKPIDNSMIRAPGGALVLNSLNGNRYGATMADGHYGEVEVSTGSLGAMRDTIEAVMSSLSWTGPAEHRPR